MMKMNYDTMKFELDEGTYKWETKPMCLFYNPAVFEPAPVKGVEGDAQKVGRFNFEAFASELKNTLEFFVTLDIERAVSSTYKKIEKIEESDGYTVNDLNEAKKALKDIKAVQAAYEATHKEAKLSSMPFACLYAFAVKGGNNISFPGDDALYAGVLEAYKVRTDKAYSAVRDMLVGEVGTACQRGLPSGMSLLKPSFALRRKEGVKKYTVEELCDNCARKLKMTAKGVQMSAPRKQLVLQQAVILFIKEGLHLDISEKSRKTDAISLW